MGRGGAVDHLRTACGRLGDQVLSACSSVCLSSGCAADALAAGPVSVATHGSNNKQSDVYLAFGQAVGPLSLLPHLVLLTPPLSFKYAWFFHTRPRTQQGRGEANTCVADRPLD